MGLWNGLLTGFTDVLKFLQNITGSYGFAIIILTIGLRLLLWPLTHSQVVSARRMQTLQPEIEKLRKKYKNDQARMNQEMMKLWKENKVNPAAGCLPLVVQLPFLWAIYQAILKFPDLKGASFLWIKDLATFPVPPNDPLFILPLIAGVTTYIQMKMTTPAGGAAQQPGQQMQQMMVWVFPPMVVMFTAKLAAGVGLYWAISNVFTILQQKLAFAKPVAREGNTGV